MTGFETMVRNVADCIASWRITDPRTFQGAVVYAVVFAFLAWAIERLVRAAIRRVLLREVHDHVDPTATKFLAQLARFGVYAVAFITFARFIPALSGLGTAGWASVSVISVIMGFAAQNTLGNLIAGFSLLLYRPFKLGDELQVLAPTGLETGIVESLTLGYTLLRTDENRCVVVPNSIMAGQTIINLTGNDSRLICLVPIGVGDASEIDRVRAILLDVASHHSKAQKVRGCPVTQWGNAGAVLTLEVWVSDALTGAALKCDLLEQIAKRLTLESLVPSLPQTRVILSRDHHVP
jgi:small-conductance mechanosensitive channel